MNEVATVDARSLARALLADTLGPGNAALATARGADIAEAIEGFESEGPLIDVDPNLEGKFAATVRDCLRVIGGASWPEMEGKTMWIDATMLKLANDLPGRVMANAARKALSRAYRFQNEVEAEIRTHAASIQQRNAWALRRLCVRMEEMEREALKQPRIESEAEEITIPEIARLLNSKDEFGVIRMGVNAGWITEDQLAAARALDVSSNVE